MTLSPFFSQWQLPQPLNVRALSIALLLVAAPQSVVAQLQPAATLQPSARAAIERELLWGEAQPGMAWDAYTELVTVDPTYAPIDPSLAADSLSQLRSGQPLADGAAMDFLARGRSQGLVLRAGAHRRRVCSRGRGNDREFILNARIQVSRDIATLGLLVAYDELRQGRDIEAVRVVLDLLQFGGDHLRGSPLLPEALGQVILKRLDEELFSTATQSFTKRLSGPAALLLGKGIEQLSTTLPIRPPNLKHELRFELKRLQAAAKDPRSMVPSSRYWRFGFSRSRAIDHHLASFPTWQAKVDAAFAAGKKPTVARLRSITEELARDKNPFTSSTLHFPIRNSINGLELIARLRLATMLVRAHRGELKEPLPDPGGGPLLIHPLPDGRLQLASVHFPRISRIAAVK